MDKELKIDSEKIRRDRAKTIKPGEIAPGADAWEKGEVFQLNDDPLKAPTRPGH